jgi:hypothetical protein
MSLNTENLLYLTTAFQPTASYKKASFIDFWINIQGDKKPYHISMARDCMGLGWIETDRDLPKDNTKITRMPTLETKPDQTFSNWFPIQLSISGKPARYNALRNIIQSAINAMKGQSRIICISRLAVFKQESGGLEYCWEFIDGSQPELIADHIGDPGQLLSEEILNRKLLTPPIRIGTQKKIWEKGQNRKDISHTNIFEK